MSYFTKIVFLQISFEEIHQNSLKWRIYQTLKKVKLLVLIWQAVGEKIRWIIWCSDVYCLENNDSIW